MSLIEELKRRNVFKVSAAYLALGWVVTQVTGAVVPALNLPDSINSMVVWMGVAGFPFVVIFSWVFELTPEGLKRESEVDRSLSITHITSRKLDYTIIALLVAAMAMFAADRFLMRDKSRAEARPTERQESADTTTPEAAVGRASARQQVAESSPPAPDEKSIAVLPFADMSQAKDQEYFSDGISEELLNLLAKIPQLKVIARTSSFAYKGQNAKIADVARELNVAHILEGSVRKSGNKVRITVQLVRAADSTHLWSETYDRSLDDIFAVQDEIAAAVVEQLKIQLLGAAPTAKPMDPQAYPLILQANAMADQRTAGPNVQAIALYQQALALAPAEARAWIGLGRVYFNQANDGEQPYAEGMTLAREAVHKAIALDPDNASAHAGLGRIASTIDLDLAAAARHYQRALELEPTNFDALYNIAGFLRSLGRVDDAISVARYLVARDPANPRGHINLGLGYYYSGELAQAVASTRRALALSPNYGGAHNTIGQALLLEGDAAGALAEMQADASETWRMIGLPPAYHALGRKSESDAALAELIAEHEQGAAYNIAYVFAYRNEPNRAFEWLDKALTYQDAGLTEICRDPMFANLHHDPRWLPFLSKLGRAPEQLAAIQFRLILPD